MTNSMSRSGILEPGTRVVMMLPWRGDFSAVPGVEWAKISETQRSTNPDWIEVTFKRFGETRTETWHRAHLRMDRR